MVDAAYDFWENNSTIRTLGYPITGSAGTAFSGGYTLDFNWTYDGTVIKGWQLTPGITFTHSAIGDTPTLTANYLEGAKSMNFYCPPQPESHEVAGGNQLYRLVWRRPAPAAVCGQGFYRRVHCL